MIKSEPSENPSLTRAEERMKAREQRASDAQKVMAEIGAARDAERAKTERLRALRLAKEEADRTAALEASPSKKPRSAKARSH